MKKFQFIAILGSLLLLLTACGGNTEFTADPKEAAMAIESIKTYAVQTMQAEMAFQTTDTLMLTSTPLPTKTPALAEVTPTREGGAPGGGRGSNQSPPVATAASNTTVYTACDGASFVSDVTIPDYTELAAGAAFVKTWSLSNSGSCTWTEGYAIAYVGGDLMSGTTTALSGSVAPWETAEISISLVAPETAGEYTSYWRMVNEAGEYFGDEIFVLIVVSTDITLTPTYTYTPTATTEYTATPTNEFSATPTYTTIPTDTAVPTETPTETPAPTETPTETPVL